MVMAITGFPRIHRRSRRCMPYLAIHAPWFISANSIKPSMQTLAEHLSMARTTLTAALKPLERRVLVSVRPDDLDRRGRNVNLTDEGVQLLRDAIPLWKKLQRRITREMGTSGLAVFRARLHLRSSSSGCAQHAQPAE